MDKNVNIVELRAAEEPCWKAEKKRQKALRSSDKAVIQAYLCGNRAAAQSVSDEDPEIPQDPKGRAKRHRPNGRRSEFRHVDGSVEKITHPTRVADEEIRDFVRGDQALDDSQEDPGKSFRRRKKRKFGTEYASQKPFRKADRLNAAQARKDKKEKKAKRAADKQIRNAEKMAEQAKAAAEREEARMSHEPIRFTGATDVAAQTHGKKKTGRLPSRGRRA